MFTPNPNLFNQSFGGGFNVGTGIADAFQRRRDRSELEKIAQAYLDENYGQAGAGLIGLGQVGPGVDVANIPFNREQQRLQQEFQNQNAAAALAQRQADLDYRRMTDQRDFDYRAQNDERRFGLDQARMNAEAGNGGPFKGNSVQAQALNSLVLSGQMTPTQAAELAAGKVIHNADGSTTFFTPQGVMTGIAPQQQALDPLRFNGANPPAGTPVDINAGLKTALQGGQRQLTPGKPLQMTESQGKAGGFADRIGNSLPLIFDNPNAIAALQSRAERIAAGIPLVSDYATSQAYKSGDQAKRDIINAILRRESGAAIGAAEFENADRQYFPQPGDGPEVIAQKRANLETVLAAFRAEAGPSYQGAKANANQTRTGVKWEVLD